MKMVLSTVQRLKLICSDSEEEILLRSFTIVFLPKILDHDMILFKDMLFNLFPSLHLPLTNNSSFINTAKKVSE